MYLWSQAQAVVVVTSLAVAAQVASKSIHLNPYSDQRTSRSVVAELVTLTTSHQVLKAHLEQIQLSQAYQMQRLAVAAVAATEVVKLD